jgi:hypothetical protein
MIKLYKIRIFLFPSFHLIFMSNLNKIYQFHKLTIRLFNIRNQSESPNLSFKLLKR